MFFFYIFKSNIKFDQIFFFNFFFFISKYLFMIGIIFLDYHKSDFGQSYSDLKPLTQFFFQQHAFDFFC